MLGSRLDYLLLRPFTHSRNIATEEELDAEAGRADIDMEAAQRRVEKLLGRLEGHFPVRPGLRYLDVGCGTGDMTLALALRGATRITGIDIMERCIVRAKANARRLDMHEDVEFVCGDINSWSPPHKFDVVVSHEALEHIEDPEAFLVRLKDLIVPSGVVVLAFGPLFHSPFGDHMDDFFQISIPWRGVIFADQAILQLRRDRFRPADPATSLRRIAGHLNMMRYSEFLNYLKRAGWGFDFLAINPQLKRVRPAYWASRLLVALPFVRDYFASSVYAILKPAD